MFAKSFSIFFYLALSALCCGFLHAENMESSVFSAEVYLNGVCLPAQLGMDILQVSDGVHIGYVASKFRTLPPDYGVLPSATFSISPNDYQKLQFWYWGPMKFLNRAQSPNTGSENRYKVYTDPYTASDWNPLAIFWYKNWGEIQQGAITYYWRTNPENKGYFSLSGVLGGRFFYLFDTFRSVGIKGNNANKLRIGIRDRVVGPRGGLRLSARPLTQMNWNFTVLFGKYINIVRRELFLENAGTKLVSTNGDYIASPGSIDVDLGMKYIVNNLKFNAGLYYTSILNLATAPGQLGKTPDFKKVQSKTNLVIAGVNLGIEFAW